MGCRTPPPAKKGDGIRMWLGDAWGDLGFIAQEDGQAQKASQIWNLGDNSTSPETPKWALCLFFFILNYQGRLERKISRLTSHNSFSLGYEGINQQDTISCMGEKCRSNWKHSRQVSSCASWAKPIDGKGNLIGRKKKEVKKGWMDSVYYPFVLWLPCSHWKPCCSSKVNDTLAEPASHDGHSCHI